MRDVATLGVSEIRLAPERTLLLLAPDEETARACGALAAKAGFIVDAEDPRAAIVACPGAPACASGQIAARDLAAEIAERLGTPFALHVSGCAKRCARPGHDGLTLLGEDNGASLVWEPTGAVLGSVAERHVAAAIGRVAALWASQEAKAGEAILAGIGAEATARVFVGDG